MAFTLNGRELQADGGDLIIDVAERNGVYIPRFCYHPRMKPVGMCRMCIVDVDTGRGPALQPSCMLTVTDGMVVDTDSEATKKAQDGVLEFLLINHPLDCPVCDKGGECPLQDQTLAFGPGETRFVEEKRHFSKPLPISDLVLLDRERCILCDRCTRFASDVAGDALISFMERGNQTQVLTFPDDPFASYFSGNTVQICPVGALTATPYRFKARPWDLEQVESTCTSCSVGCRVAIQSSRDEIVRYLGVDIEPVNHGWLCDRGRFDFEAVNSDDRLQQPFLRDEENEDRLRSVDWNTALKAAAAGITAALEAGGPDSVAVLGGSRLTNESAYAWAKLARDVIGTPHLDAQLGDGLPALAIQSLPRATIAEACTADTLILLGPDLKEELPVLYLRIRGAIIDDGLRAIELAPMQTGLSRYVADSVRYLPGEAPRAVAELLESDPSLHSGNVVVILGRASVAEAPEPIIDAAALLLDANPNVRFLPALRRGNVMGALDMGLAPDLLAGRRAGPSGLDATGILQAAAAGKIGALVLLGADPLVDFPDRNLASRALVGADFVVSVDTLPTDSTKRADVVLAASTYAEVDGTTTNVEGRVSTVSAKVTPAGTTRPDWMIAAELAFHLGGDLGFVSVGEIWDEIRAVAPTHANLELDLDGTVATGTSITFEPPGIEEPARDAYVFRLVSGRRLYDLSTSVQNSPSLAGLATETLLHINPKDLDGLGVLDGSRIKVTSSRVDTVMTLAGDEAVSRGTVWLGFNLPGHSAAELIDVTDPITELQLDSR